MSKPAEVNGKKENAACKKNSEKQKRAEQGMTLPGSDIEGDRRFKQDFPTVYFREDYATIAATETGKFYGV